MRISHINVRCCVVSALALSGLAVGGGCIPLGTDFTQVTNDHLTVDASPAKLCGDHGMIHKGMPRADVEKVTSWLRLGHDVQTPVRDTYSVRAVSSRWYLFTPEGGGVWKTTAFYALFVEYDAHGLVSRCGTSDLTSNPSSESDHPRP